MAFPTKKPPFSHSLISRFEVRIVPILRERKGYEKMWLVPLTKILKTTNVVCTDYSSVYTSLFSIEKK